MSRVELPQELTQESDMDALLLAELNLQIECETINDTAQKDDCVASNPNANLHSSKIKWSAVGRGTRGCVPPS